MVWLNPGPSVAVRDCPRPIGLDESQIAEAARLYEQGDSLATIGTRIGVTAHTVRSRLIEAGVEKRSPYDHLLNHAPNITD